MTFGSLLKEARTGLGLDQEIVAQEAGVSRKTLYRYESEEMLPKLDIALRLAAYYGLSLDELRDMVRLPGELDS